MTRTTLFTVLCIGLRMTGLILIASPTLQLLGYLLLNEPVDGLLALGVAFWALTVAFGFYLWLWPGPIARLASDRVSHEALDSSIDAADLQYVGFSLLGCWFVVCSLLELVNHLRVFWVISAQQRSIMENWQRETVANLLESGLYLILGLFLLFGARGLMRFLQGLRYTNTPAIKADDTRDVA